MKRCWFLLIPMTLNHVTCTKSVGSDSVSSPLQNQGVRYSGSLDYEDSISVYSPMTPLAETIRKYTIQALKRQKDIQTSTLWSHEEELPVAVQNAIMDTLLSQEDSVGQLATPERPCRIDPKLISPAEIVYSLKRASLGFVDKSVQEYQPYGGKPWKDLLGYGQVEGYLADLLDINLKMEKWLRQFDNLYLRPKVAASLGIVKVPIRDFDLKMFLYNFGNGYYFAQNKMVVMGHPALHSQLIIQNLFQGNFRCFVAAQVHYLKVNSKEALQALKSVDPYEDVRLFGLVMNREFSKQAVEFINGKNTISSIALNYTNESFLDSVSLGLSLYPPNVCSFKLQGFEALNEIARNRIKRIHLGYGIFDSIAKDKSLRRHFISNVSLRQQLAQSVAMNFKKNFPKATEYKIDIAKYWYTYDEITKSFAAELTNFLGQMNVQKFILKWAATEKKLPDSLNLKGIKTVVLDASHREIDLPDTLNKMKGVENLVIKRVRISESKTQLDQTTGPFRLKTLSVTSCLHESEVAKMPLQKIAMGPENFPNLSQVRIGQGCFEVMDTPLAYRGILEKLTPFEWIDLVMETRQSDDSL